MEWNCIFRDHMVLQRGKPIRVFGPGTFDGIVYLAGEQAHARAYGNGWLAELPALPAGGPYTLRAEADGQARTAEDVYIGDVFLLAGQSNMQFRMTEAPAPLNTVEPDALIRYYGVRRPELDTPMDEVWRLCDCDAAPEFSAIGYHIARRWRRSRNVAVGLVACFQGAAMIQSFLDPECIAGTELDLPIESKHVDYSYYPLWNRDGQLYEGMFRKIVPFGVSSVIWYQGESNTSLAEGTLYDRFLAELVREWRADLQDDELLFVVVQIHNYVGGIPEGWRLVREAQERAVSRIRNSALARTADLGEEQRIHPENKEPVAERVFRLLEKRISRV